MIRGPAAMVATAPMAKNGPKAISRPPPASAMARPLRSRSTPAINMVTSTPSGPTSGAKRRQQLHIAVAHGVAPKGNRAPQTKQVEDPPPRQRATTHARPAPLTSGPPAHRAPQPETTAPPRPIPDQREQANDECPRLPTRNARWSSGRQRCSGGTSDRTPSAPVADWQAARHRQWLPPPGCIPPPARHHPAERRASLGQQTTRTAATARPERLAAPRPPPAWPPGRE